MSKPKATIGNVQRCWQKVGSKHIISIKDAMMGAQIFCKMLAHLDKPQARILPGDALSSIWKPLGLTDVEIATIESANSRLEMIASGRIAEAMNLRAIRAEDLSDKHRDMIAGAMPTQKEIDNDRWTEHAA
jgi:hypothetical protein